MNRHQDRCDREIAMIVLTSDTFATLRWGTSKPGRRTIDANVRIAFVFTDWTMSLNPIVSGWCNEAVERNEHGRVPMADGGQWSQLPHQSGVGEGD